MNLRQLRYFVKVIDAGNMTRAAEQLHVAQPALGMQIRQLEEDLGVALIVRHSRGIEPTKAGTVLHAKAMAILRMVDETRNEVTASDKEGSEAIRLGVTPALMRVVGPEIAINVRERLPQIILTLVENMSHVLVDSLLRDEIDVTLCYDVPDVPQLSRTAVHEDDLVLVTLPNLARGQPVTFAEVLDERLVLPEKGDSVRSHVESAARKLGLELKTAYEIRSIPAIRSMIARGAAAGILPYAAVVDEVLAGRLDARPIIAPNLRRTLFLAFSRKNAPFQNELALTGVIRSSLRGFTDMLGPLGHPLLPRDE